MQSTAVVPADVLNKVRRLVGAFVKVLLVGHEAPLPRRHCCRETNPISRSGDSAGVVVRNNERW